MNKKEKQEKKAKAKSGLVPIIVAVIPFLLIIGYVIYVSLSVGVEKGKISGVIRVYMNEPKRYTYFTRNKSEPQILRMKYLPEIFYDAPKESDLWIDYRCTKTKSGNLTSCHYAIHLHSIKELQGGAWDHGKRGKGHTHPL